MDKKPSFTDLWYNRDSLMKDAKASGWDVKPFDLKDTKNLASFYIFEPLVSGFRSIAMFDFADMKRLVNNSNLKPENKSLLSESLVAVTLEFLTIFLR